VRGPHELSHPAARALGRDWLGQAEVLEEAPPPTEAAGPAPAPTEPA
jgi:hypothetical protein